MPGVFMRAAWKNLLMVNFTIDPAVLRPYLPNGTELETWRGETFVSVVGFEFLNTRVLGIPLFFHGHFPEVNLRFYVRRQVEGVWRTGVVFIKEIVPRRAWLIATGAKTLYRENYVALPMTADVAVPGMSKYEWKFAGKTSVLAAETHGEEFLPGADHPGHHFSEHYWGYSAQRDGGTLEYQVEHPPWTAWECRNVRYDCRVADVYGEAFVPALTAAPHSAFIARGSDVLVRGGVRIV